MDKIDARRCAVLLLDFTTGIVDNYATQGRTAAANAATLSGAARKAGAINIFVVPKQINFEGKPLGELLEAFNLQEGDLLLHKSKIGAFDTTDLDAILRRLGRDILIVTGIATSGIVLSTTRTGYDLGYKMIVVEDACSDQEDAVHALLTTPVYKESWIGLWRIAEIVTTDQVVGALR